MNKPELLRLSVNKLFLNATLIAILLILSGCTTLKRFSYEGFNRDEWQYPVQVVDSLEILPGDRIADIGSGSGYFALPLSKAVGPAGKVYAVDVDSKMNEYLAERVKKEGYGNIEIILAKYDDPLLPESGVGLIFICNTYHHLEDRVNYFTTVKKYLRTNGRVAIIDFNGKGFLGWFLKIFGHGASSKTIKSEMESAGYRLDREFDFLPFQNFLVFSRVLKEK
jgi:ubiquinone/menaquinone biosynthesis C-methylase UbiE